MGVVHRQATVLVLQVPPGQKAVLAAASISDVLQASDFHYADLASESDTGFTVREVSEISSEVAADEISEIYSEVTEVEISEISSEVASDEISEIYSEVASDEILYLLTL